MQKSPTAVSFPIRITSANSPPQSTPSSTFARPPPFPARQDPGGAATPRCRSVRDLRARPGQGRGAPGDFRFCSCVLRLRRRSRGRRVARTGRLRGRPTEARTYCAGGGRRSADGPHLPTFADPVETKAKRGRGTRGRLLPLRAERASNLVSFSFSGSAQRASDGVLPDCVCSL